MEQLTAQLCDRDAAPGSGSSEASVGVRLDQDTHLPICLPPLLTEPPKVFQQLLRDSRSSGCVDAQDMLIWGHFV
jgi:hypothetical protein